MQVEWTKFTLSVLFVAFGIVFGLWPFALLGGLLRWRGAWIELPSRLFAAWLLIAVMRIFIAFNPLPNPSLLIPEPASTPVFIGVGFVALLLAFIARKLMYRVL